jgi:hypothetical protein
MALTYLKDAPDADLPKAVKISESDPGTDVGAYRWWGDPLPHGGPYTSVVLQLRNAANDGYIDASQSVPWSALTGTPTTLAGYGITDAASSDDLQDAVGPAWETLVDAATVEWDTLGAPYSQAKVTLGGNRTLDLQNMVAGAHGVLMVIQDGTGSRTLTLDGSNLHTITLSTAASAVDLLGWWYDGTTIRWAMLDQAGGGGGASALDDLTDVAVSSPAAGHVLVHDGTNFANRQRSPLNSQSGTTYTLVLGDIDKYVICSNASAIALTVPPNSSVAFPVGIEVHVEQGGAGAITLTPGSGVTLNKHAGFNLVTDGQYSVVTLKKTATDTWTVFGKLDPV